MRLFILTLVLVRAALVDEPAKPKKCTPMDIAVRITQKLTPKEYVAEQLSWDGSSHGIFIIIRTEAEDRFKQRDMGDGRLLQVCKEHHTEKYDLEDGFSKNFAVYEEAPRKKSKA